MERNLKIFTENIDGKTLNQVYEMMNYEPFNKAKVRIMPDTHQGKGSVIGFTANITDKVIPNVVGVDIGCGMFCLNLGKIELDLKKVDEGIRKEVPAGTQSFEYPKVKFNKMEEILCFKELEDLERFPKQIGTLGGGNHFIELDKDDDENIYLVIHTGSRNLGKQVAEYYQNLAVKLLTGQGDFLKERDRIIKEYTEKGKTREIQDALKKLEKNTHFKPTSIPKDLCYLEGEYKDKYLHDMKICQEYALLNRETIAKNIIEKVINPLLTKKINYSKIDKFQTIHNYINFEDNIVRKGAISAKKDEIVIIPINMRDGSIIARGKENEDWNCSAPHGAGRILSRTEAKELISLDDYAETMKDIYTTSVCKDTIDESPFAYKSMQEIIDNTKDTIDIIKIIKPIYNFKASM